MTRRVLPVRPRAFPNRASDYPMRRKGEPVVTAIWTAVSAITLVLGLSFPCLGALESPLHPFIVPAVASLYALALAITCAYNRLRYGRIWLKPLPRARSPRTRQARSPPASRRSRPLAVMIG